MIMQESITPQNFYPRPPRGGRPAKTETRKGKGKISIHALREEGDASANRAATTPMIFLSTPSARRATGTVQGRKQNNSISIHALREEGDLVAVHGHRHTVVISIHALREEGDATAPAGAIRSTNFYPRPPRGGRHHSTGGFTMRKLFLSTPSARRATAKTEKNISAFVSL